MNIQNARTTPHNLPSHPTAPPPTAHPMKERWRTNREIPQQETTVKTDPLALNIENTLHTALIGRQRPPTSSGVLKGCCVLVLSFSLLLDSLLIFLLFLQDLVVYSFSYFDVSYTSSTK